MSGWRLLAAAALLAGCAAAPEPPAASRAPDPNGLLHAMQACLADPAKPGCTEVDRARGFVVLKDDDPEKPLAWLIVPSDPEVTGIEDPAIFSAPVADFWRQGWQAGRRFVPAPPERLGLAINSEAGRTQNLLHIHISCLAPEARTALATALIGPDWAEAPWLVLDGRTWNARRLDRLDPSPFLLLRELPGAAEDSGLWSLALLGAPGGGYVLLADSTRPGAPAGAEALLDETCRAG